MIYLDALPGVDQSGSPGGGWQGHHAEFVVVLDVTVRAISGALQSEFETIPGRLAKGRVHRGVIEFVGPLAQTMVKRFQSPDGVILRVNAGGHLAHVLGDLRISRQTVDQLRAGSKEPFTNGSKPWLGRGPGFLGAFIARQQRLEVDAVELLSTVDDQDLRKASVPPNAFPQDHHAGSIGRRVEGQEEGQQAPGKCVHEDGQPRPAEVSAGAGAKDLHVEFGVIDMADVKGPVTVARGCEAQFQVG